MEDSNKEEWIIQEFSPPQRANSGLSRLWDCGLNLGKKIAVTGIVVSAAPLALPPLVVLSAFGVAFTVPFGLYLASYAATDKLMSTLLSKPKQPPPLLLRYGYVVCDQVEGEVDWYGGEKVEEEIYEENCDLREEDEEEVFEDDASEMFNTNLELGEEGERFEDGSGFYMSVEDSGEVIVERVEEGDACVHDGEEAAEEVHGEIRDLQEEEEVFEDDASETFKSAFELDEEDEKTEDDSGFHASVRENDGEKMEEEVHEENGDLQEEEKVFEDDASGTFKTSVELGKEDVKNEDDSGFHASVKDNDGERVEAQIYEVNDNLREEEEVFEDGASETLKVAFDLDEEDEIVDDCGFYMPIEDSCEETVTGEILEGIRKAEEETPLLVDVRDEMGEDRVEANLLSAEVGGKNDIDLEQVEEVDVLAPRVSIEDTIPSVKFGDVEPEELERETKGMVESIREEGKAQTENPMHLMEISSPSPSFASNENGGRNVCSLSSDRETSDGLLVEDEKMGVPAQKKGSAPTISSSVIEPQVEFGDVEHEDLERETKGMIESIKDEGKAEAETSPSVGTEFAVDSKHFSVPSVVETANKTEMVDNASDLDLSESGSGKMATPVFIVVYDENNTENGDLHQPPVVSVEEAVLVSAEVGGESGIKVKQGEGVDLLGSRVKFGDVEPGELKFGDVEPGELERETKGMIESIRDEGKTDTEYVVDSKQFLVPSEKETAGDPVKLQSVGGPVEGKSSDVKPKPTEIEKIRAPVFQPISDVNKAEELKLPSETEMADAFAYSQKSSDPMTRVEEVENSTNQADAMTVERVSVRKLVVRVKKAGDQEIDTNKRGGTLIVVSADTRKSALDDDYPEGMGLCSGSIPGSDMDYYELPSFAGASTSNPVEVTNITEDEMWKHINAMRTILGYEAAPCSSCVDELRALYVFVGVEPPAPFGEPTSMADIDEKLQSLMAIVGVKK